MLKKLWNDDNGIVALEYMLVATIVGLSLVVGLSAVSRAINLELVETANAIAHIDQSYAYPTISICDATKLGSSASDLADSFTFDVTAVTGGNIDESLCAP